MIDLKVDYLSNVNYVLAHNRVAVCNSVELSNNSGSDLSNVMVECKGEFVTHYASAVLPHVENGRTIRLNDYEIRPNFKQLAMLTERISTTFEMVVWSDVDKGEDRRELFRKDYDLELQPFDHWLGYTIVPNMLASFVTPNHPMVQQMVVKGAKFLKTQTGESAFLEYQTGDVNDVVKQVAAVFAALHAEGIIYRSLPASFEEKGQRVTMPDKVLSGKMGNCVELTTLFASILEALGINSVIAIKNGHAFLGVWLVNDCCRYSVCDDLSYLGKKCSIGIDEMLVLESTMVTNEKASFEESVKAAQKYLTAPDDFLMFIDVYRSRLEGVRPLPQFSGDDKWIDAEMEGLSHDKCDAVVHKRSRYDLSKVFDESKLTKMDIWERKLLDFSLRNNMLNMYLRMKAVQLASFEIDKLEDRVHDGQEFKILEKPSVNCNVDDSVRLVSSKQFESISKLIVNDMEHKCLHTYKTEGETRSILKNIYRTARTMQEESGANSLYLAIGVLRWNENTKSGTPRYAPLMLLPVDMLYKKGTYSIRTRGEDMMLNVTLLEFLRQNYEIKIPALTELPTDEHGVDVNKVFAIMRTAIADYSGWDVEEEAVVGIFSFSKFLMWNDIHNHKKELLENPIVSSLVERRLTWKPDELVTTLRGHDKELQPDKLSLPVAVDSSQMAAVFEAGLGHSFILYGPPGTGKSQTITNLVANALFQGKRVLFVAEKMAALSVVQKRLEKVGLGPFCLEMHSNKVTKRHVLNQLAKALGVTHIKSPEEYAYTADKLYEERKKLIVYLEAVHNKTSADDFSLYDCIMRCESIGEDLLDVEMLNDDLRKKYTAATMGDYEHLLTLKLSAVLQLVGQPSQHSLKGLNVEEKDLADETALKADMQATIEMLNRCRDEYDVLRNAQALRANILKDNDERLLNEDAEQLRGEWRSIRSKWVLSRLFAKRGFLKKLREYNQYLIEVDIDGLIENLCTYQEQHGKIEKLQAKLAHYFMQTFACDQLPTIDECASMVDKLERWKQNTAMLRDWYHWCTYRKELLDRGLGAALQLIENSVVDDKTFHKSVIKTFYSNLAKKKISESADLRTFEGMMFDAVVEQYRELAEKFRLLSQKELYARLASRVPRVTDNVNNSSEIGLLNRNISNGGRGLSLRDLMKMIPSLMPRLCPCMLMSPMSVAQFLDLGNDKFDLVIFDEASQMPTSESVGAIARGKALIVVGDPKQMPPTSFFNTMTVGDDEADIDDMESILEECRALEIPSLQLNWHYRSRHESLIAFSNNEYYDGNLITFPSVDDKQDKVQLVQVKGVYDKGGQRSNMHEAEAIANEIERRLRDEKLRADSIGVIAFSVAQQNLIEDVIQKRLDSDAELHEAAANMYEPIFIKNLENVQGDERDVILFSVGYGPDKNGKVSMNFGPLNNAGGERRLNVAVTRSRKEMIVYTSLKPSDIDLNRSKARGVEGLKHFLEFAAGNALVHCDKNQQERNDAVMAQQLAVAIQERGYVATANVGRSKFKIDVAISRAEEPDKYVMGVLIDGEGYRDTQTTRDREIVQPSVLTGLGWRVMRVWSVDWINNPKRVIDRIVEQINAAPKPEPEPEVTTFDISQEKEEEVESAVTDYVRAEITKTQAAKMSDLELSRKLVKAEQPITLTLLCRRINELRGVPRTTKTMLQDMQLMVMQKFYTYPDRNTRVIWESQDLCQAYNSYRQAEGRDINDIPMCELENVVMEVVREQFSINRDSVKLVAAKKLGFARRGQKVDGSLNAVIDNLVVTGKLVEIADNITLPEKM